MNYSLCPSCLHFNTAAASLCNNCGASLKDTPITELPQLPELVVSDPAWQAEPAAKSPQRAEPAPSKAAHRAEVRRRRLAAAARHAFPTFAPRDVLVLDPDDGAREQLSQLLDEFGFCACPAHDIAEARELLATRTFAAAFLDIVLDGAYQSVEAELCRQVKLREPHQQGRGPALIIVSDRARSVDRVRATLAGADGFLVKPAQRGDVVRALDESGVALPTDSRQA
jgi:CheY-like chemotaxis protein